MINLENLQNYFQKHLLNKTNQTLLSNYIDPNGLLPEQRLQIYRNNMVVSFSEVLQSIYPCIQKLVGEEFFNAVSREYILHHPSRSGNLHAFGQEFPVFLKKFPSLGEFPYLMEVACLEWACHEVYHGIDPEPLDLQQYSHLTAAEFGNIVFLLHPSAKLFSFQFPVQQIWDFCQKETDCPELHLAEHGDDILVRRDGLDVVVEKLQRAEYLMFSAFINKKTFAEACAAAIEVDANFDINSFLQKYLSAGTAISHHII